MKLKKYLEAGLAVNMVLKTKGKAYFIDQPIVGRVSRTVGDDSSEVILIVEGQYSGDFNNLRAILTTAPFEDCFDFPSVYSIPTFEHLEDGDLVVIHSDGTINTLYRINSRHNSLLFTERCNSNCLMCSQPPKNRDDTQSLFDIYSQLVPLIPKDCMELGITGGEPTLMGQGFFNLLSQINEHLPETDIHCLTNGRTFALPKMSDKLGSMNYGRLMLGIPLYSDYYQDHDYIVQAKGAFNQTMRGLYNLAENNQRIEIRIVLHKLTIPRLTRLAQYIYKNLPFVEHIAFMGLEYQGYTPFNFDKLWIDPREYMQELSQAVTFLSEQGLNVSIYNTQLCLMPEQLWQFNKRAISDWKNAYVEECTECTKRNECGGFFSWNTDMPISIKKIEKIYS